VIAATLAGGSFQSENGVTFLPMTATPHLGCLASRADGSLVGCGANWQPDFMALGTSATGSTWSKVFRFVELAGPIECPATSAEATMSAPLWPGLRDQFGATGPTCTATPGEPGPDASPPPPAPKKTGCCDAGDGGATGAIAAFVLGALLLHAPLRRRRHSPDRAA
jgi:hypothetical protein